MDEATVAYQGSTMRSWDHDRRRNHETSESVSRRHLPESLDEQTALLGFNGRDLQQLIHRYRGPRGTVNWSSWLKEDPRPLPYFRKMVAEGCKFNKNYLSVTMKRLLSTFDPEEEALGHRSKIYTDENLQLASNVYDIHEMALVSWINYVLQEELLPAPADILRSNSFHAPEDRRTIDGWGDACTTHSLHRQ